MCAHASKTDGRRRPRWVRRVVIGGVGLVVVLAVGVLLLPVLVSTPVGNRIVLGWVNERLQGGRVEAKALHMSWFDGVRVSELTFSDARNRLAVRELTLQPDYVALLVGHLILGPTVVESPEVRIHIPAEAAVRESAPGTTGQGRREPGPGVGAAMALLAGPLDIAVRNGQVTLHMADAGVGGGEQTVGFENLQSQVTIEPEDRKAAFQVSTAVVDSGGRSSIRAEGNLQAQADGSKAWTLAQTSGRVHIEADKVALESLRPLAALLDKPFDAAGTLDGQGDIELAEGRPEKVSVHGRLTDFRGGFQGREVSYEQPVTVDAEIAREGEGYRIDAMEVQSSFCTLKGTTQADAFAYELTADVGRTQEFIASFVPGMKTKVAGRANVAGQVQFGEAGTRLTAAGTVEQLVVSDGTQRSEPMDVQVTTAIRTDTKSQAVYVESLRWNSPVADLTASAGPVSLEGRTGEGGRFAKPVSWRISGTADLARAAALVGVVRPLPEGLRLAGKAKTEAEGTYDGQAWTVRLAPSTIEGLAVRRGDLEPFMADRVAAAGRAMIDLQKGIDVQDLDLRVQQGESTIHVTKGRYLQSSSEQTRHVEGRFEAAYDLRSEGSSAGGWIPTGLTAAGSSTAAFESDYKADAPDGFVKGLTAEAAIDLAGTRYRGIAVESGRATVKIADGRARVRVPEAKANGGTLRFDGMVDLTSRPYVLECRQPIHMLENIQINAQMGRELLMYLNPIFVDQGQLTGILDFEARQLVMPLSRGYPERVVVAGTVAMDRVTLQSRGMLGEILAQTDNRGDVTGRLLPTDIVVRDGQIRYDAMEWLVDRYPIGFFGTVGLDKRLGLNVRGSAAGDGTSR